MRLRLFVCGFWKRNLYTLTLPGRNGEKKNKKPKHTDKEKAKGIASRLDGERKAEQNTRERGERRKHIIPGTGREVRRRRERWERGKEGTKKRRGHILCASLRTGYFENFFSSNDHDFKRSFLLS